MDDTGCMNSLADSTTPLLQEEPTPNGLAITAASNEIMTASSKGNLPFSLTWTATGCHRVQSLHTPILYVVQLCDAGCTAIFNSTSVNVVKTANVKIHYKTPPILTGTREPPGLWYMTIPQPAAPPSCTEFLSPKNDNNRTIFLHAAAGYPPGSTFCK